MNVSFLLFTSYLWNTSIACDHCDKNVSSILCATIAPFLTTCHPKYLLVTGFADCVCMFFLFFPSCACRWRLLRDSLTRQYDTANMSCFCRYGHAADLVLRLFCRHVTCLSQAQVLGSRKLKWQGSSLPTRSDSILTSNPESVFFSFGHLSFFALSTF